MKVSVLKRETVEVISVNDCGCGQKDGKLTCYLCGGVYECLPYSCDVIIVSRDMNKDNKKANKNICFNCGEPLKEEFAKHHDNEAAKYRAMKPWELYDTFKKGMVG